MTRQTGFDITAASEVMATLALTTSLADLRQRLGRIVVGYTPDGTPVTAEQLDAAGSMAVILRDAIKPNLLQTLENTPVLVHTGPFGNIATGNSSVVADLIGIHTGDFLVTEAGFGADMGAERFFNIKCRNSGLRPGRRGGRRHGPGAEGALGQVQDRRRAARCRDDLLAENPDDVLAGADNLRKQIENVRLHGVPPVGRDQRVPDRPPQRARRDPRRSPTRWAPGRAVCTHFADGGRGAAELAEAVAEAADEPDEFRFLYPDEASLRQKIETVAPRVYGAAGVTYSAQAVQAARHLRAERVRPAPGLHRQDAPVDLVRPGAQGGADRLDAAGPGGPRLGRRRVRVPDLRRDAHDAGPVGQPGRGAHRHRRRRRDRGPVVTTGLRLPDGQAPPGRPRLILPGLPPADPRLESYRVHPGAVTAVELAAGDEITIIDAEGRQRGELTVLARGGEDFGELGTSADARGDGAAGHGGPAPSRRRRHR